MCLVYKDTPVEGAEYILRCLTVVALFGAVAIGCVGTEERVLVDAPGVGFCLQNSESLGEKQIATGDLQLFAFNTCPDSGWTLIESSCDVELNGSDLIVSTLFVSEVDAPRFGNRVAQLACNLQVADCNVGTLPNGEFELVYREERRGFEVPSDTNLDCDRQIYFQEIEGL